MQDVAGETAADDARGNCLSPTPLRARVAEAALQGKGFTSALAEQVGKLAAEAAQPISDIRGTADYRRAIVGVLAARVVALAVSRATVAGTQ